MDRRPGKRVAPNGLMARGCRWRIFAMSSDHPVRPLISSTPDRRTRRCRGIPGAMSGEHPATVKQDAIESMYWTSAHV
jgi:hypothetical protein